MRLCKNPTYVTFAYTAGILSSFGRDDPNWRGTPPYRIPSTRPPQVIGEYPPKDENALAGLLRQKRVEKNDSPAVKETKRKGAQARKEYKPTQRAAVRRKRALRAQSLKLSEPLVDPGLTPEALGRGGSPSSKRTVLREAIRDISAQPSREVLNNVNVVDRYERWQRGQLTSNEIADINTGKISLPSKQDRDAAHSFLTKTNVGSTIPVQSNKVRLQGVGGRTKEIQQIMQEAQPVEDVLSGKSRKTGVPSGEGSLTPLVKDSIRERNAKEATRLADPSLTFDKDIAIARGVDPKISTAPSYVAPSSRDASNPLGIKEGAPLKVQYTPKSKGVGLQTRRDKIRRVLASLEGGNEYDNLNLSSKVKQDAQLLPGQLKPERIKKVAAQKTNQVRTALDNFVAPLNQTATPPPFTSTMQGVRTTPVVPTATATATATPPVTSSTSTGTSTTTKTKGKTIRKTIKATGEGAKGFTINIQMPDGQVQQQAVPPTSRTVDTSALPNVGKGKNTVAAAEKTGEAVTNATRGGLMQRIRAISPGQSKLLKGGAALAGAGGILLGGNALANSFTKKSSPIPETLASYPPGTYGY